MSKEAKEKVKKPLYKKIIDWFIGIIIVFLCAIVGIFAVATFTTNKNETYGLTFAFDHSFLIVLTDSMEPEYKVDSCIIIKKVNQEDVKIGDDLTFYYEPYQMVVTHRVVDIIIDESSPYYTFKLHGINTNSEQCKNANGYEDCTDQYQIITSDKVLGKVVANNYAFGQFLNFMLTPYGLIILLLIPGSYLIFTSARSLIKALKDDDEVKTSNSELSLDGLKAEDIERLKKDLLNEMLEDMENGKNKKTGS